jgi:hypothetical protein
MLKEDMLLNENIDIHEKKAIGYILDIIKNSVDSDMYLEMNVNTSDNIITTKDYILIFKWIESKKITIMTICNSVDNSPKSASELCLFYSNVVGKFFSSDIVLQIGESYYFDNKLNIHFGHEAFILFKKKIKSSIYTDIIKEKYEEEFLNESVGYSC